MKYLRHIIPYFEKDMQISNLHVFVPPNSDDLRLSGISQLHTWPVSDFILGFPKLRKKLSQLALDAIFIPTARWIDCGAVPVVVMVRNMEPLARFLRGNYLGEVFSNLARHYAANRACKQASQVLAVSQFVKNFLIKRWHIPCEKLNVVYHGIDRPIMQNKLSPPAQIPDDCQKDFIFTAGSIRRARGLEDILCAMKHLRSQGMDASKLLIAGTTAPRMVSYQEKLKKWIETHNLSSKVFFVGSLNEIEMAWCYQNCTAFVMTSRVEACPNIALEAMSYGCICIAANNPPLPEIFRNTSVYYPPKDGEALADAIKNVLAWNPNQQKAMHEKARARAAEFSWDVCAEKTVALLTKAARDSKKIRDGELIRAKQLNKICRQKSNCMTSKGNGF